MKENQYDQAEREFQAIEAEMASLDGTAPAAKEVKAVFRPIWYTELAELDIPLPSWVVDKLIPEASITIISAAPAQYKTWVALDIAIQVACGRSLYGQFNTKQTKVLIMDEESGLGRIRERLQKLGIASNTSIAVSSYNDFKLNETSSKRLIAYCKDTAVGLVIFDSLTRIHTGDENSAKDMSAVMGDLKRFAQAGIAVLLIHHNRKPGQFGGGGANEMRGSGDILAACDVQISVKRKIGTNTITVTQHKNRDAANLAPFDLNVNSDEDRVWFEYIGNAPKRVNKAERTDEAIRKLIADNGSLFQEQIIEGLKSIEGVGGEKMIPKRLKVLLESGELTFTIGASGKHLYELKLGGNNE